MDGGESSAELVINKRFVSEAEIEERRKRRQEEWEKVRKPEDPEGIGLLAGNCREEAVGDLWVQSGYQPRLQCLPGLPAL